MSTILANTIAKTRPGPGEVALFYLGQAGFILKTSDEKVLVIDAYLSDAAERLFGFKRMIPAVIQPAALQPDVYLSTHEHIDHLDLDAIPAVVKTCPKALFIGAPDCEAHYKSMEIPLARYTILREDQCHQLEYASVRAIYADHGDLAPEAVGYLISTGGLNIYHAGDTAYRPDEIKESLNHSAVDVLIVPINGQYGNMNAAEAVDLAKILNPSIVIPAHFWMFLEHVSPNGAGDPATFLKESARLPKTTRAHVMAPGEMLIYRRR